MARIIWTPQSLDDLDTVCDFIAKDSQRYAQAFAVRVFAAVERLAAFPMSGHHVPEIDNERIRQFCVGNYRIIYRLSDDVVQILTVFHGARLLDGDHLKSLEES